MNGATRTAAAFIVIAGALPAVLFVGLTGFGALPLATGLCAAAVCLAVAICFAALLGRDLASLTALVRAFRSAPELPGRLSMTIPGLRAVGEEAVLLLRAERLARDKIRDNAAEDRALVERLPDPLLKLDTAGAVLWRNASADTALGLETGALLRHPEFRSALAEANRSAAPIRKSILTGVPVSRDLDITLIPVGGPIYLLVTDRTHERSLEKMRADFVANASHELRTPLASLIGFIETLRGPAADDVEVQQRFLGIMDEQAQRMQRVIADLLSLSRIEMSEHQPPDTALFLPPLLERIAAAMEPMLAASGTKIELTVPHNLPAIAADADQLTQVFTNLLDNAIKYGKRGGAITFAAKLAAVDPRYEPNGVIISVTDEGPGIAREHIPRLTERFYRVDRGRSRAVGGTGLGLAIVKHVVSRHRGRLFVDSVEGSGTVFTVWLPARPAPPR